MKDTLEKEVSASRKRVFNGALLGTVGVAFSCVVLTGLLAGVEWRVLGIVLGGAIGSTTLLRLVFPVGSRRARSWKAGLSSAGLALVVWVAGYRAIDRPVESVHQLQVLGGWIGAWLLSDAVVRWLLERLGWAPAVDVD